MSEVSDRLEYLRSQIRAECISWGELGELQGLAEHIEPGDVELLEWAGVPEFPCDSCGDILPGVIEDMDTHEGIQRCDECSVYDGDLEAALALADHVGGVVRFHAVHRWTERESLMRYDGADLPDGICIADGTNPWVEIDGTPVSWPAWKTTKGAQH